MTTKLDELVGYLAGRPGNPEFLEELTDPDSEARLFLEATRSRSRSLIQEPLVVDPVRLKNNSWRRSRWWGWIAVGVGLGFVFCGFWLVLDRLEAMDQRRNQQTLDAQTAWTRLDSSLNRLVDAPRDPSPAEVLAPVLTRLESSLDRISRRLEKLEQAPGGARVEPSSSQVRDDLASLRLEIASIEKSRARQTEDLEKSIHEVARILRLLINRIDPATAPGTDPPRPFPAPRGPGL